MEGTKSQEGRPRQEPMFQASRGKMELVWAFPGVSEGYVRLPSHKERRGKGRGLHGAIQIRAWEQRAQATSKEGSNRGLALFRLLPSSSPGLPGICRQNSTCHSALSCG